MQIVNDRLMEGKNDHFDGTVSLMEGKNKNALGQKVEGYLRTPRGS
jgi:hypothetical protein